MSRNHEHGLAPIRVRGSLAESPARALNRARGHVRLYVSGLESVLEQVLRTVFHLLIQRKARVLRRPALPTRRGVVRRTPRDGGGISQPRDGKEILMRVKTAISPTNPPCVA